MKRLAIACLLAALPALAAAAPALSESTKTSVAFVANYDDENNFLGWGSGFFVDEGTLVTNKHVIQGGDWYRVYATGADGKVDLTCRKNITKSDVKINLDDDVAYMRVFLPCDHGVSQFTDDPDDGVPVWVLGFPYRGSVANSLSLLTTSGSVTGMSQLGWLKTDAALDFGNSGGPVVDEHGVVGVAVAKGVDENGKYTTGYFIQASVILNGLLYANDSRFGYTPQAGSLSSRARSSSSASYSVSSTSSWYSFSSRSSSSFFSRSSVRSSSSSSLARRSPQGEDGFEGRTCARVSKWFGRSPTMKARVNGRLLRRFGFECR